MRISDWSSDVCSSDLVTISSPVSTANGVKLASPKPLVVPILRAGLGMLDGMVRLLPTAEVGFLGMIRNEETLEASTYAEDRKSVVKGKSVSVSVALGGRRIIEKKTKKRHNTIT